MFSQQLPTPEQDRVTNFINTSENFKKIREMRADLSAHLEECVAGMENATSFSELWDITNEINFKGNFYLQAAAKPVFFITRFFDTTAGFGYYLQFFMQELKEYMEKNDLKPETNVESGLSF